MVLKRLCTLTNKWQIPLPKKFFDLVREAKMFRAHFDAGCLILDRLYRQVYLHMGKNLLFA